ncbi:hypothetical protein [Streptomyces sp. GC420]|uniref:hypothetical protein n=1 Tax=Streptomyces sp. GC420 TaxID=2697568 RepID=UPI001FB642F6|nr:hypothetical protein [Streptomyces sp. GC420]
MHGKGTCVADPLPREAMRADTADTCRIEALEAALRDVLSHIRPQGQPDWQLNTCLVSNDQVTTWWAVLGAAPRWQTPDGHPC